VSRIVLVTGVTGETGRINSDDPRAAAGRIPAAFVAVAAAGVWCR
jgi:hypothetical protein